MYNSIYFKVIGIYEKTSVSFEDEDSCFIPFSMLQQLYNMGDKISWMDINVKDKYNVKEIEPKIKKGLKDIYNISPEDSHAFGSFNLGERIGRLNGFMSEMRFLYIIVGILTLFSGVMAISSILLITVKERTKEFGIRRALGALPGQIRGRIIIKSIVLISIAGMSGTIIATGALYLINTFIVPILKTSNSGGIPFYNATIDLKTLSIALCVMVFMATLAGLMPAQRANRLTPCEKNE